MGISPYRMDGLDFVMGNRKVGESVMVSIFDKEFNRLPVVGEGDAEFTAAEKPEGFESMITIAETLSRDFPHVRVDLYNLDGNILFSELTFFNASGYMKYIPDEWDYTFGKGFTLRSYR